MATEANITIKLLIDTKANKVVFAEASNEFVDLLLLMLALPIGSVTKVLTTDLMVGSFGNLYKSFVNLDQSYVQQDIRKNLFLDPKIDLPSVSTNNPLPICSQLSNATASPLSDVIGSQGYVEEMVTYMVSDDLSVMPLSTMSIISMINECKASKFEERHVDIGTKEALELLKTSFQSTKVLTDVFLGRKYGKLKDYEVEDNVIARLSQELEEKNEEVDGMTELVNVLIRKERRSHNELQDARRQLITILETLPGGMNIGIKTMGEMELSPFEAACKRKCGAEKGWEVEFLETVSLWKNKIVDQEWRPFKIIDKEVNAQEVVDEDDNMLKGLRTEWGDDVYNAVVKALVEINEYNPSRQQETIKEVWNYKEDRKASLREAIQCICDQFRNPPSKRRRAE